MFIERELRFYFSLSKVTFWQNKLRHYTRFGGRFFNRTLLYDNPNPALSFYAPEVDGRFRLRLFKVLEPAQSSQVSYSLISWKQRLKKEKGLNIEKELEIKFAAADFDLLDRLFRDVLKMPYKGGYELYRSFFYFEEKIEITLNEYPFALALELELKEGADLEILSVAVEKLGLKDKKPSLLSNDDFYAQLCRDEGLEPGEEIFFRTSPMPQLKDE